MANTLTGLTGAIYSAVDMVSRELVGFIPSISLNGEAARAAVGQAVTVPVSNTTSGVDISPAMTVPEPADKTVSTRTITITKSRAYPWAFIGEERRGLNNGVGYNSIQAQEIAQAIRGITNEIENDIAAAAYIKASRAYGTAGTTPFASDLSDTAQVRKILADNGAPVDMGWNLVFDTTAGAKLRTLTQLTKANEAADTSMLRQGTLLDVHGGELRESAKIKSHTKGTGTSYVTNGSFAVGATTIAIDTGSGTVLAGDVVTFAGDTNKYVVKTALVGGNIVIAEPGLQKTLGDGVAMTIGNSYTANVSFTKNSIQLAHRLPSLPEEGDAASERMTVVDPRSGMVYEFSIYKGYRKVRYEVAAAWGVDVVKEEHSALLLG